MTKVKKEQVIPEHRDVLGNLLAIGDYVAYPESNALRVGTIEKLNPKMLRIKGLSRWTVHKYPNDVVKLDGPTLTAYLLKR